MEVNEEGHNLAQAELSASSPLSAPTLQLLLLPLRNERLAEIIDVTKEFQ
jgi:hypothetical protein